MRECAKELSSWNLAILSQDCTRSCYNLPCWSHRYCQT